MKNRCIVCNTDGLKGMYKIDGTDGRVYTLSMCVRCNIASIHPIPVFSRIAKEYEKEYYKKDSLTLKSILEDDIPFFKLQRKSRMESFKSSGRVLDIGCGGGGFLKSLDSSKWERHGLEISDDAAAIASKDKGLKIKIGRLSEESYPASYFDVVTLWHVFEHLLEPHNQLKIINRILKSGGLLVIAVPNIDSLEARVFKKYWYHLDVPRHVYHYSPHGLEKILKDHGFKILKVNGIIPKNLYGIIMSLFNRAGFDFNLFKDLYMKNVKLRSFRVLLQATLMAIVSPAILLSALLLFLLETASQRPGTFEIFAVKEVD